MLRKEPNRQSSTARESLRTVGIGRHRRIELMKELNKPQDRSTVRRLRGHGVLSAGVWRRQPERAFRLLVSCSGSSCATEGTESEFQSPFPPAHFEAQ